MGNYKCYSSWDLLNKPNLAEGATVRAARSKNTDGNDKKMSNDGFFCDKMFSYSYISLKDSTPSPWIEVREIFSYIVKDIHAKIHSNKFLRIYITNHLNLTLNYRIIGKYVANIYFI